MKTGLKHTILLFLLGGASFAHAQEISLDPVTVTATLREAKVSKTGRNILVINGAQFSNLPVHSLDELLRYVPGVEIQQRGPMGSQSDIVLRGATFGQVLVLLDGLRVNDPNTGHFNANIPVSPAEIDHIEILKGPASAIYGSEAVGGVINIITRSFAARKNGSGQHALAEVTTGEYELINANLGGTWQNKNTAVGGGFLTNNSDGQPQRGTRSFFNNYTGSISFSRYLGDHWKLSVRTAYDDRKFSAQNFYTTFVSDTADEQVKVLWNVANISWQHRRDKVSFDAGYKFTRDRYAYNSLGVPNQNKTTLFQSKLAWQHQFNSNTSLVAGSQFQNKGVKSNDRGDHTVKQAAAFVLLNQSVLRDLELNPALRLDYDERAGAELVPQLNLSYTKTKFSIRGSVGKTIRQPDFTERFNNYNKTFVTGGSIGNPGLVAERSLGYEVGADYSIHALKISSTVFRRNQRGVIDWVTTPYADMPRQENLSPTGTYALATNVAKVTTTGVEADLQYSKIFSGSQALFATLGCTWLHTVTSEPVASFYILSHAKFLSNLTVNYKVQRLDINLTGVYRRRDPVSATAINVKLDKQSFTLNLKLGYNINRDRIFCFVEADNLLNNHDRDIIGSMRPARWLMGGVKLEIGR